jgi:hypothetical protein
MSVQAFCVVVRHSPWWRLTFAIALAQVRVTEEDDSTDPRRPSAVGQFLARSKRPSPAGGLWPRRQW